MQQPRLVRLLSDRAHELGVDVRWGHELIGVETRSDGVAVSVSAAETTYVLNTTYLVGADGGRSTVRKMAGIDFPGYTSNTVARIAHVRMPDEMRTENGGIDVPGFGPMPFGHNRLDQGGIIYAEFERDRQMLGTIEFDEAVPDDSEPMTLDELRDSAQRVLGVELPVEAPTGDGPHAMRRIAGQNTRQADRYRAGNILLLGDSAHVHSAMGGPGLNLGLQDAVNLGWKLAAVLTGRAEPALLDTYEAERRPAAERVIMHSRAQLALIRPGREVTALRELFSELLTDPAIVRRLSDLLSGADIRYALEPDAHPLTGRWVPDFSIEKSSGTTRVAELARDGRPLLLDLTGDGVLAAAAGGIRDLLTVVAGRPVGDVPATALLVRPDGYVAWASSAKTPDVEPLGRVLARWFGMPSLGPEDAKSPVSQ
jgi:2-polyprenyl-6-methoxyphenol hydroxylase-like FAD-dependent oxidoreductase